MIEAKALHSAFILVTQLAQQPPTDQVFLSLQADELRVMLKSPIVTVMAALPIDIQAAPDEGDEPYLKDITLSIPMLTLMKVALSHSGTVALRRKKNTLRIVSDLRKEQMMVVKFDSTFPDWKGSIQPKWLGDDVSRLYDFNSLYLSRVHQVLTSVTGPHCKIFAGAGNAPVHVEAADPSLCGLKTAHVVIYPTLSARR